MNNKEKIVRYTSEEIEKMPGQTNWEKVDSITDEELDELVKNDPDDVYLTDEDFASGKWVSRKVEPKKQAQVTIRLDEDVLDFFRQKGKGYQSRINHALRAFMAAQQKKQTP